jgi:hypothetical protein
MSTFPTQGGDRSARHPSVRLSPNLERGCDGTVPEA